MKRTFRKHSRYPVLAALLLLPSVTFAASDIIYGPTGTEASLSNPDGNWLHNWDGLVSHSLTFDAANPPSVGDTQGSIYVQGDWTGDNANTFDNYQEVSLGTWAGAPGISFDGSQYTSIEVDFKYDTNSTMTPGTAPHLGIGFDLGYNFGDMGDFNFTNGVGLGDGNWHHLSIPVSLAKFTSEGKDPTKCGGVSFYEWNPPGTSGTMNYWVANVKVIASIVQIPPPSLGISKSTPGLHFVEGSISGEFDRQNIITANGANSTANYSWAGVATGGNPVTYSFNISQFTAPDLNYHIFIYQTAGAGGASAPDYNQTNVLDLQITPIASNTQARAQILWKTNLPSASTTNIALDVTNSSLVGTWQLQFSSDTTGQVLAPGGNSYPFTLDPNVPANLANPVTVNFGINPSINDPKVVGEEVIVSQVGISGVDPLSTNHSTSDNFLADPALDPATWTVNAHNAGSIWFVPTGTAYSISWNIPDTGFSLIQGNNLLTMSNGVNVGSTPVALTPGKRSLVSASSLPVSSIDFFALIKRPPYQLQVLLPGEMNAPNTVSGKTGTPIAQTNGVQVTITINMCDLQWNILNSGDTVHVTSSDGAASLPPDAPLVSGTLQEPVFFNSVSPPQNTVTASDTSNTNILSNTSSPVTVEP
jgi:hypothetical protein